MFLMCCPSWHNAYHVTRNPQTQNGAAPMPNWTNRRPENPDKYAYNLVRTPPDRPLTAICTADDLLGCHTHFYGNRTVPCEAPNCPACDDGMPSRWHAYLSAFDPKTHTHFLFECTAKAAQAFETYRDTYGTLRGCYFQALRPKRRKNSAVTIVTKPADLTRTNLPPPLDIPRAMSVIWQLPTSAIETPTAEHSTPTVAVQPEPLNRMRGQTTSNNGRKKRCTTTTA
jgi:hypothetical protein